MDIIKLSLQKGFKVYLTKSKGSQAREEAPGHALQIRIETGMLISLLELKGVNVIHDFDDN